MKNRRKAREYALQILYQWDLSTEQARQRNSGGQAGMNKITPEDFWRFNPSTEEIKKFAMTLVEGVWKTLPDLDAEISKYAEHWSIDRMPVVDRNILRFALYELLYIPDIPSKVTINEAIDIAKKYGTEKSGTFVNAILDKIARGKNLHTIKGVDIKKDKVS